MEGLSILASPGTQGADLLGEQMTLMTVFALFIFFFFLTSLSLSDSVIYLCVLLYTQAVCWWIEN